jgi:hypothetical protein
MIKTEKEYESSKQALEHAEKALAALDRKLSKTSPDRYYLLSKPYLSYIHRLRSEINKYSGVTNAEENALPLWIKLKGPEIGFGNVSMAVLYNFLRDFKLGVQRIAEYIYINEIRTTGRPVEDIRDLCDFKVKILPGSVRMGVSFPHPFEQKTLFDETIRNPAEEAVKKILVASEWAVGLDYRKLEKIFPNAVERSLLLRQMGAIAPKMEDRITDVEFKGKFVKTKTIRLTQKASSRIKKAIVEGLPPESKTLKGIIREIDLDRKRFRLRDSPDSEKPIRCNYLETIEEDIIKGLNKKVKITGILHFKNQKPNFIDVDQIEILKPYD